MAQCTLIIQPVLVNGNLGGVTDSPYGYGQHNFIDIANWGIQVPVHATASSGYTFSHWEISGAETGNFTDNPHNFTILPGYVYIANVHFVAIATTSTVNVRAYANNVETSGVAHVTISETTALAYYDTCYCPCTRANLPNNTNFLVLVTYPGQTYQQQTFWTGAGTTTDLRFDFTVSTIGTLTVYGRWDGQEVPVSFTIDGVSGSWTTNIQLDLNEGDYTVRGHYLQQDKVYTVHVTAGQNTDLTLQMDYAAYGYITIEATLGGNPVPAHILVKQGTTILYDLTLPEINGSAVLDVLPGTYTVDASYGLEDLPTRTVTITAAGEGQLVQLVFSLPQFALTVHSTQGGFTDRDGTSYWESGTVVSVTATANTGYTFAGWNLDGTNIGTTNPYNITMLQNHSLTANFRGSVDGQNQDWLWIMIGAGVVLTVSATAYTLYSRKKKSK